MIFIFYYLFFRIIGYGLGFVLILLGIIFFCCVFSCKLHTLKEEPALVSKPGILAFSSFKLFALLGIIMFLSLECFSSDITTLNHVRLLLIMTLIYIVSPKYVLINQNQNLKFYFNFYHHQPPPILPWQLPRNFSTSSVNLVVLSYENE